MLFNSFVFAVFLPLVFAGYWALQRGNLKVQNAFLLIASYVFYGWWDVRFLSLIIISSLVDYQVGRYMVDTEDARRRKLLLFISLAVNLGFLGVFKYAGFFVDSFADLLESLGMQANRFALQIVLPVGISFYTFQTLSYTIDIYRRKITATHDPLAFFAFVSFFPQLVAGPIERARDLLPQFTKARTFDESMAVDGVRQMLWGLFKKVVIADNVASSVDLVFTGYADLPATHLAVGVFLFAIQIYCDFSGYSDIAIGCARLFGFQLSRNFAFPYFSRDIAEFWRRWHISLSTWFRDYVYIPLGGSRAGRWGRMRNIIITFTVSGFWHGANWTFIVWGLLNGLYYIPLMLADKQKDHTGTVAEGRLWPGFGNLAQIGITFALTLIAWVFFRADSLPHAFDYLARMASGPWSLSVPFKEQILLCCFLLGVEWIQRDRQHGLELPAMPRPLRWAAYYSLLIALFWLGNTQHEPFIYFQF